MKRIHIIAATLSALTLLACKRDNEPFVASGSFEATEVIISSESNGRIIALDVSEGELLQAGQIIGQIDSTQLYLQKMALLANNKGLRAAAPDLKLQTAALEDQIEGLQREKARTEKLLEAKAATLKQLDDIKTQLALVQSQLGALKSSLSKNRTQIGAQSSSLEIQVAQIQDQIDKCSISSPMKATVIQKYAERGELANMGRPLLRLAVLDTVFLRAYIPGSQLAKLKLNETKEVRIDFGEEEMKSYQGKIVWIAQKAEFTPKNVQSKDERDNLVYAIKVAVPNDGYIKIAMYGELLL